MTEGTRESCRKPPSVTNLLGGSREDEGDEAGGPHHGQGASIKRWRRCEQTAKLAETEAAMGGDRPLSQRQAAKQAGVARTTVQHWQARKAAIEATPESVAFFESPEGLAFLHRLMIAAHLVITLAGAGGIRLVCLLFELTGVDRFVASSYGAQQQVGVAIETAAVAFGQQEKARLGQRMGARQITTAHDETFHPQPCLVAMEPVSNFILLERYAPSHTADQWQQALEQALEGLPVEVIQATSDEGTAIRHHVERRLGAHHSPDLFHVQHELVKATAGALATQTRQAEQALSKAREDSERQQQAQSAYLRNPGPGRPPNHHERIRQAACQVGRAKLALEQAQAHQNEARQAIGNISQAYHPYHLHSGQAQSTETVAAELGTQLEKLEQIADQAKLSQRCRERIEKAGRVVTDLLATLVFFFMTIAAKVEALSLPPEAEQAVLHQLIPALYLQRAAGKIQDRSQRQQLRERAEALLQPLRAPGSVLLDLAPEERCVVEQVAAECADLFQRSSSCVEGRNGQLALRHHHLHRISDRKLAALTTVHNYFIQRPDGTTAAERFFGNKPTSLFDALLEQVPMPARAARKRAPRPAQHSVLQAAA